MTPFISVVMPVRNEARFIKETLEQLLAQEYPADRFEVLVVDGRSDDATRDIVSELSQGHGNLRLLDNPKRLSSAGRNVGFKRGRGDYFLVVDGHCHIPDRRLLANLADCFGKTNAFCLGRPQPLDPPGLTRFQTAVALARGSCLGHGGDSLIYSDYEGEASPVSNGAAYHRSVFETVGFCDEAFDAAEDVEFNYRVEKAGLSSYSSHRLTVRYYPRESLSKLFRQMKRYGIGRSRFLRKHPEASTLNQLVPAFFVLGFLLLLAALFCVLATGRGKTALALFTLPYAAYLVIVLGETLRVARQSGWRHAIYLPAIFPAIHFGLGVGFLQGRVSR